jgi:glutathione S-transferase
MFRQDPHIVLRVLTTGVIDNAYQRLRAMVLRFPVFYRFRHKISDTSLEADRATVNAALDLIEQERQGRRSLVGEAFTVADLTAAAIAVATAAETRDSIPLAAGAAAAPAKLPCHAAAASGRAVGGRDLPTASGPLRGSLAAVS